VCVVFVRFQLSNNVIDFSQNPQLKSLNN